MRICIVLAILIVLMLGVTLSYFGGYGIIPVDPAWLIPITLGLVLLLLCFLASSFAGGYLAHQPADKMVVGSVDLISRVIVDPEKGQERIFAGPEDATVREALEFAWPFRKRSPSSSWRVLDKKQNDVTDLLMLEVEGVLTIVFPKSESVYYLISVIISSGPGSRAVRKYIVKTIMAGGINKARLAPSSIIPAVATTNVGVP